MSDLNEQITILQSGVDERNTLITRLRAEGVAAERNMAGKASMLAVSESQLAATNTAFDAIKSELSAREKALQEALDNTSVLEGKLVDLERDIEEKIRGDEVLREQRAQQEAETLRSHQEEVAEVRRTSEERLESIKKENTRKSTLARTLLTEREEENNFLKAKNEELVSEIKSGAPSDRRIFELAEVQAKREAAHGLHG